MKKQFILENIESNNTLRKIDYLLEKEIKDCQFRINYENSVLSLDVDDAYLEEVITVVFDTIHKVDETINIVEREVLPIMRKVLILEGLDCANCSAKIERIAKRTFSYESLSVDFATTRFIIETTDAKLLDNIVEETQKIAAMVDPRIVVKTKTTKNIVPQEDVRIAKKDIILFSLGLGLFIIGVLTKFVLRTAFGFDVPSVVVIIVYAIAYSLLATDVIFGAFKNIISGRIFDEKFLMTLATLVALGIGFYEEAVSVMIFYKVGMLFQEYAVNRSRRSIAGLIDIKPTIANVVVDGEIIEVDPDDVLVGDYILVKMGERIPIDGVVVDGEAALDVSALTGESKYLDVKTGDNVISGSVSTNGTIKIKVSKVYEESMVAQILDMVENASSLKSKSEHFISKFAKYYTPAVCLLAFFLGLSPLLLRSDPQWVHFQASIYSAMIFLVVSCPCALVISIPLGFFGGIGGASRHGILVKGSNYLESLAETGSIIFDKTGTLTKGTFHVEEVVQVEGCNENILEMAAYCEMTSNHPIAKSIVQAYGRNKLDTTRIKIHPKSSKFGLRVYLDGEDVAVGNDNYMDKLKIKIPTIDVDGVVVHIAKELEYCGYIILKDEVRQEAKQTIQTLHDMGIKTAMFTGDKEIVAKQVAYELSIPTYYSTMMPVDKVKKLRQLKKTLKPKEKQIYIGDGINDAPVLSMADVGIAMGQLGSDAAIKVADVVLMNDDLTKLPTAINIARKTRRIVIQNIVLALSVKFIVMSLAPFELAHMWEAIFADVGVSLIAIINSLRAANIKLNIFKK